MTRSRPLLPWLGALLVGGVVLWAFVHLTRDLLSITTTSTLPGGARVVYSYPLGMYLIVLLAAPILMFALAFREQRVGRAMAEALAFTIGFLGTALVDLHAVSRFGVDRSTLLVVAAVAAGYFAVRLLGIWLVRLLFVRYVAAAGPICTSCGYDLRDIQSQRCPECGRGLEPQMNADACG